MLNAEDIVRNLLTSFAYTSQFGSSYFNIQIHLPNEKARHKVQRAFSY